jgi:prolipoprotein diacylglyceryltransferase
MSETGSPPLWGVLAYLVNIIVSVAMIWYLINFFLSCSTCTAKPLIFVFFIAFLAIILISSFRLFGMLFPEKKKSCPACTLMTRIIEIDLKVH